MEKQDFAQYTEKELADLVGEECYIMFDRLDRFILDNYKVERGRKGVGKGRKVRRGLPALQPQ